MRNQPSTPVARTRAATSPVLVAIAIFLAMLVAFRIADMCGYLPDGAEVDSALAAQP
jgi:hypothetical protein